MDSTQLVPGLRPRGGTFAGEDAQRKRVESKRSSSITGALGAVKDAVWRPPKRDLQTKKAKDVR